MPTTTLPRRAVLLGACAATLLAVAVAGCGDDADDASSSADASGSNGSAAGGEFPVTIEQAVGDVTIEDEPERVVALDFPSADAAIALGVAPVGMAELSYLDGGVHAWTAEALDGAEPELFSTDDGFPFETIARLEPDVILATNTYPLISDSWDSLNAIAPVVGHIEGPGNDTWQQGLEQVGRALGRSDRAEELIADVEAAIAGARDDHPAFGGKTVSFFNYVGGELYVINNEDDVSIRFLTELGFAGVTDAVADLPVNADGTPIQVSAEQYEVLDADLLVGTSSGNPAALDDLTNHPTFPQIPAVTRGAYITLDIAPAAAIAFPSVLSLPHALDELLPDMAAAVARD